MNGILSPRTLLSTVALALVTFLLLFSDSVRGASAIQPSPLTINDLAAKRAAQATSTPDLLDKLVTHSYPRGLNVYIVPKAKIQYGFGNLSNTMVNLLNKEFLVGTTPLEIGLEEGDYQVTVDNENNESHAEFWGDGEDQVISHVTFKSGAAELIPCCKSYALTKHAGHSPTIIAVFWPKDQSLHEFVMTIGDSDPVFPKMDKASLEATFRQYNVPSEDWADLVAMMQKTGKLVWHGKTSAEYLYVRYLEVAPTYLLSVEHPTTLGALESTQTVVSTPMSTATAVPATLATTNPGQQATIPVVTANKQWKPIIQSFGDVEMALVPPGCFMMGSNNGLIDEKPVNKQCFYKPFWIDKYDVTNAQFNQFNGKAGQSSDWTGDSRPRNNITWFEARDFCVLRGARLPTEAEWEYAARGPDNLVYPWGNNWDANKAVFSGNSGGQTADVGSKPAGASWVGALDMSGNIWQWTSSFYRNYPYDKDDGRESDTDTGGARYPARVARGGSWTDLNNDREAGLRTTSRYGFGPGGGWGGFRCARPYESTAIAAPAATVAATVGALASTTAVSQTPDLSAPTATKTPIAPAGTKTPVSVPTDAPLPARIPIVTANNRWTPLVHRFDGVEMVLVPPGCFMMGSRNNDSDEKPANKQCFDKPFWIDKYDVTNAQFKRLNGKADQNSAWTDDNRPRINITWFEGGVFCTQRGARLPTEAEWEYAARGPDALVYPWGNSWNANNAVYSDNSGSQTADVGSKPGGASWVGALDMSGNVSQWTSSLYKPYPYKVDDGRENSSDTLTARVLRGGSWLSTDADGLRAAVRGSTNPGVSYDRGGFRCARSYEETSATITPVPVTQQPAIPTVTANAHWTPRFHTFDGVEMTLVPPGCFMMGTTDADIAALNQATNSTYFNNEGPQTRICFDKPFWIDRYDVTNAQFARFNGKASYSSYYTGGNRPRENVTWFDARDFCALRGTRLPTEAEWEYSARGPDDLVFPWGNNWDASKAVYFANSNNETADVGSIPDAASWIGAMDMEGNVWQWVSSSLRAYPYDPKDGREGDELTGSDQYRVLRGGSWRHGNGVLRSAFRWGSVPSGQDAFIGFRCARSYDGASLIAAPAPVTAPVTQQAAIPAVTANAQWTPQFKSFGGVEMALVPPGCFQMGSDNGESDEKPVTRICFDKPFWIDRYDVTNAQFNRLHGQAGRDSQWTGDNRPRESINWFVAGDFCALRGGRLPTEAEWEYAARGPDGLVYPWGNGWNADNALYSGNAGNQTADVGSKPGGISWVGALDMSGNVWQWTNSIYRPYPYTADDGRESNTDFGKSRVVRGGSWGNGERSLQPAGRAYFFPVLVSQYVGFRCVRAYDSTLASSPAATFATVSGVTANKQWKPRTQRFGDVEMTLVPPGCFQMGSENGEGDETPVTRICFGKPFWIDKYDVTNAQFNRLHGRAGRASQWTGDNRPRESITWFEARRFCALRGARLPTEAEWEYAARGPDGLVYPWGNNWKADNAVYSDNSGNQTADVGSKPGGASWVGALDMSGNVWQWTSTIYQPYPYRADDGRESAYDTQRMRVARGGAWYLPGGGLRATLRYGGGYDSGDFSIGFRCVRDY